MVPSRSNAKEIKRLQQKAEDLQRRYYYMELADLKRQHVINEYIQVTERISELTGESLDSRQPLRNRTLTEMHAAPNPEQQLAQQQMAKGIGCFVLAAIVSGVTYWLASSSETGGTYAVFYGGMVIGGLILVRGFWRYVKHR